MTQHWQRLIRKRIWRMDIDPTTWIAASALIDRTWPKGIHIGADCWIDEDVVILTHDLTRGVYLDTRIGARCQIGPRAIILPGVAIGAGSTVAPGALVNRDVPDGSFVVGNPGRIEVDHLASASAEA